MVQIVASYLWTLDHVKDFSLHGVTINSLANALSSTTEDVKEMKTDTFRKKFASSSVPANVLHQSIQDFVKQLSQNGLTVKWKANVLNSLMVVVMEMTIVMIVKKNAKLPAQTQLVRNLYNFYSKNVLKIQTFS